MIPRLLSSIWLDIGHEKETLCGNMLNTMGQCVRHDDETLCGGILDIVVVY